MPVRSAIAPASASLVSGPVAMIQISSRSIGMSLTSSRYPNSVAGPTAAVTSSGKQARSPSALSRRESAPLPQCALDIDRHAAQFLFSCHGARPFPSRSERMLQTTRAGIGCCAGVRWTGPISSNQRQGSPYGRSEWQPPGRRDPPTHGWARHHGTKGACQNRSLAEHRPHGICTSHQRCPWKLLVQMST